MVIFKFYPQCKPHPFPTTGVAYFQSVKSLPSVCAIAMYRYFSSVDKLPNYMYQILLVPCLRKYCYPLLFWLMREWRASWRVCSRRERGYMSSCRPMSMTVYNIGHSLTWPRYLHKCGIHTHHCFNTKLARHHCTLMCDVGVVSIHPVWVWLCDRWTVKTFFTKSLPVANSRRFVPRKLLAIQYM